MACSGWAAGSHSGERQSNRHYPVQAFADEFIQQGVNGHASVKGIGCTGFEIEPFTDNYSVTLQAYSIFFGHLSKLVSRCQRTPHFPGAPGLFAKKTRWPLLD
jgi:hypothetical protein